jgi:hypothetical protein
MWPEVVELKQELVQSGPVVGRRQPRESKVYSSVAG